MLFFGVAVVFFGAAVVFFRAAILFFGAAVVVFGAAVVFVGGGTGGLDDKGVGRRGAVGAAALEDAVGDVIGVGAASRSTSSESLSVSYGWMLHK